MTTEEGRTYRHNGIVWEEEERYPERLSSQALLLAETREWGQVRERFFIARYQHGDDVMEQFRGSAKILLKEEGLETSGSVHFYYQDGREVRQGSNLVMV